jgi:hypothetical protein
LQFDDHVDEKLSAVSRQLSARPARLMAGWCKPWQAACIEKGMKKPDDRGIRTYTTVSTREKGGGTGSAGQSGDTQGLSDLAEAGPASVEELAEEGQSFEAEAIGGVEDAPDADMAEVHTRQVPEDDVPSEYLERD